MKRRWIVWLGILLTVVLGGVLITPEVRYTVFGSLRQENRYQGLPSSYWAWRVRRWLGRVGTPVYPVSEVVLPLDWLGKVKFFLDGGHERPPPLFSGDPDVGPVLIDLLRADEEVVRDVAAYALWRVEPPVLESLPALLAVLNDSSPKVPSEQLIIPVHYQSEPYIRVMHDYERDLGCGHAWARPAISHLGSGAVPQLVVALQDKDERLSLLAIEFLGDLGPEARNAVPSLLRAMGDPDEKVRQAAESALKTIAPEALE